MKINRVIAVAKKEWIQIRRDPLSMALAFLLPLILMFIFGFAISMDIDNLPTLVHDLDKSSASRKYVENLQASRYFKIVAYTDNYRDIERYLDNRLANVVITIPKDFGKDIESRRPVEVQAILDGSDSNTANITLGYLLLANDSFTGDAFGHIKPVVEPRARVWYNEDLKSRNFIIPGLIAVIMAVIAALLTSLTIAREWERGTMEQLISTPVKVPEIIIGKLIPYFLIGFTDTAICILVTVTVFGVELKGNLALLLAMSSLFLFGTLSQGILISIVARSQMAASQIALMSTFLPAFLLSGFMISINNMPVVLQYISRILPARYFVTILKGIFLKANTFEVIAFDAAVLALFGVVVFIRANKSFKKRIP